ncbi:DUF979 domain-containing protein [Jeotgalibaca ciconiae]|uniref:DUF979 domain-containing protein n=1 Tax=Jeotgalibaca ciconiae TaxID=2496265 RepID=A0A3Q9BLA3_9LACT|nr:DUF979 domain-containing protein [Jeotgalibaca ciconiae]AZP04996.1 DUF979 domain-containing protein [Jeotgalibaca ciconiae]HJB23462.1 DUF979 domain-containing protein [Candidatus Jeotgalibaca pullicola]
MDASYITGTVVPILLELFFILIGLQLFYTAYRVLRQADHPARWGTAGFWILLGILFAAGNIIPPAVDGVLLLGIGALTLLKQVKVGKVETNSEEEQVYHAARFSNWIFLPAVLLALTAVLIAQFTPFGGQVGIGAAAILSLAVAMILFRASPKITLSQSDRMVQQVGAVGILPQLLAALGVLFTAAGVGDVIADIISGFVPAGNRLLGVIAYVLGMVIFTMIMGNGFAAFTVITAGIGIPFVISQGADPVIAGALAMTAGFCGTLMTPMAANFNALPAALLEMKNPNGVIKAQTPLALVLIVVHIALMYFWAF